MLFVESGLTRWAMQLLIGNATDQLIRSHLPVKLRPRASCPSLILHQDSQWQRTNPIYPHRQRLLQRGKRPVPCRSSQVDVLPHLANQGLIAIWLLVLATVM